IEFSGRQDKQVKIRGFRVEPGEIESLLLNRDDIKEAVVVDLEDTDGQKYLCAYFVSSSVSSGSNASTILREYLSGQLPAYMIPAYFISIEKIPLTPNGKVDRKMLLQHKSGIETGDYIAPRNETEEKLAEIWAEILGLEKETIGIDTDFFHVGGHSLKATDMTAKIHKVFNVKLELTYIFTNPVIRDIAAHIRELGQLEQEEFRAIEGVEEKEYYPASSAQRRLYLVQQTDLESLAYNIPAAMVLEGELYKEKLEEVFRHQVRRHDGFRTSFHASDGRLHSAPLGSPVQVVHDAGDILFEIDYYEIEGNGQPTDDTDDIIHRFIRPFELSEAPLLRVGLFSLSGHSRHILMVDMAHIISDGISIAVLVREFMTLYSGGKLPPIRTRYIDFTGWQDDFARTPAMKAQEEYWVKQFEDIPMLELPLDFARPTSRSFDGGHIDFEIGPIETGILNQLASKNEATLFMILSALYHILLSRLTGDEDIVFGTPVAGRGHSDLEGIIGMFVNTLVMRNNPTGEKTFGVFLEEVKHRSLRAFRNRDYSFEELVEKVAPNRDNARNPLFDTMFSLQNTGIPEIRIPGLALKPYDIKSSFSQFDLGLSGEESGNRILFRFDYCVKLFKEETVRRFVSCFKQLVSSVAEDSQRRISHLEIIPPAERKRLLEEFNDTSAPYPRDKTIHGIFERQAEKTPGHIALMGTSLLTGPGPVSLSYEELNERSHRLAGVLHSKGVRGGSVVGLIADRSVENILAILAVLKTGGAYLPMDSDYPDNRIQFMLSDSNALILLSHTARKARRSGKELINFSTPSLYSPGNRRWKRPTDQSPDAPAYVLYTSGSTGKPKGVLIRHESVVSLAFGRKKSYKMNRHTRVLQFSSISFDASVQQIFIALFSGGRLVMIDKNVLLDKEEFKAFIAARLITHMDCVPSFLENIDLDRGYYFKSIVSAGEACSVPLAKKLSRLCNFYNEYGPTETTVTSVGMRIKDVDEGLIRLPIGRPIANTSVYILDRCMNLSPIGAPGELCIGGIGVALGYLNRPELTFEKFKVRSSKFENFALYHTGDLARWLPDGIMEFLGRNDDQVKIRGFRIELGEIENRLLNRDDIREAVVLCREDNVNDPYICAYIVLTAGEIFSRELNKPAPGFGELKEYLALSLAEYMVPRHFVELEKMPLTPNGKINRKALLEIEIPDIDIQSQYIPPQNETQEKLVKIWAEVLGLEKEAISIDANFFQLGGHSLKLTLMTAKVHKELSVKLPLEMAFETPTIKDLSESIRGLMEEKFTSVEPVEKKEYYPLSSSQKRMYVLQQMDTDNTVYNVYGRLSLDGAIETGKLEDTFAKLLARHESLRTSFGIIEGEPVQKVNERVEFELEYYDIPYFEQTLISGVLDRFIRPFDLSLAPLMRVGLLKAGEENYMLIVDMHHSISDGTSHTVLERDLNALYSGETLPRLTLQYKDYSHWQSNQTLAGTLKQQEQYWLDRFAGEIPLLNLPADYPRPAVQSFAGSKVEFDLSEEVTQQFNEISESGKTTLFIVMLAVYNLFLSRLSGQEDIVVGVPVAGRKHDDLEKIIGMFVNTLPQRNPVPARGTFMEFLGQVKDNTLKSFENQDFQLDDMVEKILGGRDTSRNPLFDVLFTFENESAYTTGLLPVSSEGETVNMYVYDSRISKFDLSLSAVEIKGKMSFLLEYCTKLFRRGTISGFIDYFKTLAVQTAGNPMQPISAIEIIPAREKKKILYGFNNTKAVYPRDKTIHRLFQEQVERTPDSIAVNGTGNSGVGESAGNRDIGLTYGALNERSGHLAAVLKENGVETGVIVGIMAVRSVETVIAILAILKARGAYLPIDPNYPQERVQFMLKDSGAKVLIRNGEAGRNIVSTNASQYPSGLPSQPLNFSTSSSTIPAYV
ncbi:MAG: amino acid adenylation domain-containing protein, partial [bacterium]|nr:amino acid adenylation domain-containing protein [bacterium]